MGSSTNYWDKSDNPSAMRSSDDSPAPLGRLHGPLSQKIAAEIKSAILTGRFRPGDRLIEEDLAAELDVSRNPVREALRSLSSAGFVEIVPRRGASVAVLDTRSVTELFEVRAALEALAARLAAQRIAPEQLLDMEAVVERGTATASAGRFEELPPLNSEFHAAVAKATGNARLQSLIETVRDTIQWVYSRNIRERAIDSWFEHRGLLDAIRHGDPEIAAHLALEHIARAEGAYLKAEAAESRSG
ncbi:MAG: GntR family transcriptional regulator [Actinomycetota bacterium]